MMLPPMLRAHKIGRYIGLLTCIIFPAVSACGIDSTTSLTSLRGVSDRCAGQSVYSFVASDESGSSRGATSQPQRQQVLRDEITRTAVCGGRFRVTVFSGSVIGQVGLDADLRTSGETQIARLRKVPKLVDRSMRKLNSALPAARAQLPLGGTDTTAQYQSAAEFFAQVGPVTTSTTATFTVLTDGISTRTPGITDPTLSVERAATLSRGSNPAHLPAIAVRLIGVGRTAEAAHPLPSAYVDALKAFQLGVCQRSEARSCLVVTDPEAGAK